MSVKVNWSLDGTTYVWRCVQHDCDLEASGHSMGRGTECFPGFSVETDKDNNWEWFPDSSELSCPENNKLWDAGDDEFAEADYCSDNWELVKER